MNRMDEAFDAVVEIFSWVGLGLGALLVGRLAYTAYSDDDLRLMDSCAPQV